MQDDTLIIPRQIGFLGISAINVRKIPFVDMGNTFFFFPKAYQFDFVHNNYSYLRLVIINQK